MSIAVGILLLLDLLVLLLTVLPLLPWQAWWSRAGEFPRLQILLLASVLLITQLWLLGDSAWRWPVFISLGACLVYQAIWILPYTPLYPREVLSAPHAPDPSNCVSILAANVLQSNRQTGRLRALIAEHDPDIVLLMETDWWWGRQMGYLRDTHPDGLSCLLDNRYGMSLYSRLDLNELAVEYLVDEEIPSIHGVLRLPSGQRIRLRCLHPAPPSPTEKATSRERDAELLLVARAVREDSCSVIATGDFNDVAWSPTTRLFRKVSRLLDPRIGRGTFSTFHARIPGLRFPLDHVFHSDDFTLASLKVLPDIGSDHRPIYYRLCHSPAVRQMQEAPHAGGADERKARERIDKVAAHPNDVP